ncbi:hypothetical protein AOQ84DRAFT_299627 [Glonium stellatum]|uniref:DNA replication factor Cdt1 C-terminal domain-containing protein n=1 Tax=Glonium stellatum TaxID=574774 RepID=A0A8E2JPN9_9PEZI|nr:hypothetical protein AOQ84DRAFT_299627 [Glonium stellatum]
MELPSELNDLIVLYSSFLTALSLHYAHNGTSTPVDLRILAPSVASVWGKRKVTLEDIRLCLGVMVVDRAQYGQEHVFRLSDYGQGKICLEMERRSRSSGIMDRHIDEDALKTIFMEGLERSWKNWTYSQIQKKSPVAQKASTTTPTKKRGRPRKIKATETALDNPNTNIEAPSDPSTISVFIAQLPRAEITVCASLSKVAPLREKGRKRLQDLKDDALHARTQKEKGRVIKGKENKAQSKITIFASTRKLDLLDRVLAKQALQASLPNPPSAAELQRKAALQRAEEVLAVLSLLAAGKGLGQRVSFSMTALVQSLQGSVRSPISKDEAIRCVELLAEEVAPGYVGLVRMGSMCSVVVNQAARPLDLRKNLVALGVECLA